MGLIGGGLGPTKKGLRGFRGGVRGFKGFAVLSSF